MRKLLRLKNGVIIAITATSIMFSGCANNKSTTQKTAESTTTAEQTTELKEKTTKATTETKKETTTVATTETKKETTEAKKEETVPTMSSDEVYDELLSAVDGYDYVYDYEYVLGDEEVKEEPTTEAKKEPTTEATTEPKKETTTKATTEATTETVEEAKKKYQQTDSEGDTFVALDENGNFIENPEAPEKYAKEDTKKEATTEAKKETTEAKKQEVSKKANKKVKEYFDNNNEKIVDMIVAGNNAKALDETAKLITKGLDFLFFGGKIDGFTKDQVDKETIKKVIKEIQTNQETIKSIANDAGKDVDFPVKYYEALEFLDEKYIDKFDALGDKILKETKEKSSIEESYTYTKSM